LLIVSHDRSAIQTLCNRAILLEKGIVIKDGDPDAVFDFYNAIIAEKENSTVEVRTLDSGKAQTISGTGEAVIVTVAIINGNGEAIEFVGVGERVKLRVDVAINHSLENLVMGYMIKEKLGQVIYGTNTWHTNNVVSDLSAGDCLRFEAEFSLNLGPGSYSVSVALTNSHTHLDKNYQWLDLACVFTVINKDKDHFGGLCWLDPLVTVEARGR